MNTRWCVVQSMYTYINGKQENTNKKAQGEKLSENTREIHKKWNTWSENERKKAVEYEGREQYRESEKKNTRTP